MKATNWCRLSFSVATCLILWVVVNLSSGLNVSGINELEVEAETHLPRDNRISNHKTQIGARERPLDKSKPKRPIHKIVIAVPKLVSTRKNSYVLRGSTAFLACGAPSPYSVIAPPLLQDTGQYNWSNRFGPVVGDRFYSFLNGTLAIRDVQLADSDWYSCHSNLSNSLTRSVTERDLRHRLTVYAAPTFHYHLRWVYSTTQCSGPFQQEYLDFIHGRLLKGVCRDPSCHLSRVAVGCQLQSEMQRSSQNMVTTMLLSATVSSSSYCDLACVETAEADVLNKALENLKTRLKEHRKMKLPSFEETLLFQAASFASHFNMFCIPGTEEKLEVCMACKPGTYSSSGTCVACDPGFFSSLSGSTECQTCPWGTTTASPGATSIEQCVVAILGRYVRHTGALVGALLVGVLILVVIIVVVVSRKPRKRSPGDKDDAEYEEWTETESLGTAETEVTVAESEGEETEFSGQMTADDEKKDQDEDEEEVDEEEEEVEDEEGEEEEEPERETSKDETQTSAIEDEEMSMEKGLPQPEAQSKPVSRPGPENADQSKASGPKTENTVQKEKSVTSVGSKPTAETQGSGPLETANDLQAPTKDTPEKGPSERSGRSFQAAEILQPLASDTPKSRSENPVLPSLETAQPTSQTSKAEVSTKEKKTQLLIDPSVID